MDHGASLGATIFQGGRSWRLGDPPGDATMTGTMSNFWLAVAGSVLMAFGSSRADAAFVTYTETVIGSGSLGAQSFTDSLITITGTADTTNIIHSGVVNTVLTSTTVEVAGLGTATFTDIIQAVSNNTASAAGFGDNTTDLFLLGNRNVAFASYHLGTKGSQRNGLEEPLRSSHQ
jgi:hypothetical protein